MTPTHDELRDLVLAYEELDPPEAEQADAHLASCLDCRSLLDRVRRVERRARPRGALPPLDATAPLDAEARVQAGASLAALQTRLGLEPERGARAPRTAARPSPAAERPGLGAVLRELLAGPGVRRWAPVLVPVAAAAALAVIALWPRPHPAETLVRGARLLPASLSRGGEAPAWRTGRAFVLEVELEAAAQPIVFHVDPAGSAALLYPDDPVAPPQLLPAGHHLLPGEASGIEWRFEGAPGPETFLVTASSRRNLRLAELVAEARALAAGPRDRRVAALKELLERRLGRVHVVEVVHEP